MANSQELKLPEKEKSPEQEKGEQSHESQVVPNPHRAVETFQKGELDPSLITINEHPSEPLVILNYTDKCQKSRAWNEVTTACRGLIINKETGEIEAQPFTKFYNVGEVSETRPENLPKDEPFRVFEKLDGRLMIMYRTSDGEKQLASRGSFTSVEAVKGTEMLHELPNLEKLPEGTTFLFEAIYPDGRVVIDYGDQRRISFIGRI